jgi:RHS repeat-associated protein
LSGATTLILVFTLAGQFGARAASMGQGSAAKTMLATATGGGAIYAHDAAGRVAAVFSSGAGSKIGYDADGNVTSVIPLPASSLAIAQVSPPSARPGASVTIYGTGFGSSAPAAQVRLGGASAAIQSVTPNAIVATVPASASGSGASVTIGGKTATGPFTVPAVPPKPVISALSEHVGDPGGRLTVTGSGFDTNAALDIASVNGTKVGVISATSTALRLALPPLAVAGQVSVTTPGGSATSTAEIITAPQPFMAANVGFVGKLANATTTTISLSASGQIALALFTVPSGQRASVTVDATIPDPSGQDNQYEINIFGPDGRMATGSSGNEVTTNPDTFSLPDRSPPGTYEIELVPVNGDTGSFKVTASTITDPAAAMRIDGPQASVTTTATGQDPRFTFPGTAGQRVFVRDNGDQSTLFSPDGAPVSSGVMQSTTLPSTGTYTLAINTGGAPPGTYTAQVTSVPADVTATTTVDGSPALLTISKPGQGGVVTFHGTAGAKVFTEGSFSPGTFFAGIALFTPGGSMIGQGQVNVGDLLIDTLTLPVTGTYQLQLSQLQGYTGTASVAVTSAPDVTATTSIDGTPASLKISKPGQRGVVSFTGSAGQKVSTKLTMSPAENNTGTAELVAADGNVLGSAPMTGSSASTGTVTLPATGTYKVITDTVDSNAAYTGTVTVAVTSVPAPAAASSSSQGPPVTMSTRTPSQDATITHTGIPTDAHAEVNVTGSGDGQRAPATSNRLIRHATLAGPPARSGPPTWSARPARGTLSPASLTGTIRTTAGLPLPGVTVSIGGRRTRTDASGRFRLTGLPQGMQAMEMDGRTASTTRRSFGVFDVQVRLRAGANALPFTPYLPVLDTADEISIPEPLIHPVTLTTPAIPGLAVHLPKGITITDADGKPVHKVGITAIPVNRTPIPMPAGEQVPVYYTVQPAGGHISGGWATIDYPNYRHAAPGTAVSFWHYDLHGAGWRIYGTGTVNAAGTQVIPGPGTWVTDFNGAMIGAGDPPPGLDSPQKSPGTDGDPVNPGTGLYQMSQTDLAVADVIPLTMTRGYNPGDGNPRPFGNNSNDFYDTFLTSAQAFQQADLNLIDGQRVHYVRVSPGEGFSDAVFESQATSGQFFGSKMAWNGDGWDLTLRDGTTLVYGELGPLQEIRDAHGNTVRIFRMFINEFGGYAGPITEVVSPNGYWLAYTWDTAVNPPRITKVTDNAGRSVSYTYDASGNLRTVTDPDGHITTYGYDSSNRLTSITDANGVRYLTNVYDSSDRITSQTIAGLGTYQFSYTPRPASAQGTVLSPDQVAATQVTEPDGTIRKLTYDADGYLATDQRAAGTSVAHTITITRDSAPATADLPATVSDGLGRKIATAYDASGDELTNTYTAGGSSVSSSATYNGTPFGLPSSVTGPDGQATRFTYDGAGDPSSVTDPLGNVTSARFDPQGNPLLIQTPLGRKTTFSYHGGQLRSATDPLGRSTRYVYDQANRLIEVITPDGGTWSAAYDPDNQLISSTDPNGNTTSYAYDGNGNLIRVTDPKGNVTKYAYNNADQLTSVTDPLGRSDHASYNAAGELSSYTDKNGKTDVFNYDPLGRLTFAGYGKTAATGFGSSLTYTYSSSTGNLHQITDTTSGAGTITYTYDALGQVASQAGPGGTITYAHNAAGQLTSMTPPGQTPVTYTYDADGRLRTETQGPQSATLSYNADGHLVTQALPNGIAAAYTYDTAGQLTSIDYRHGTSTIGNVTYTYDAQGHMTAQGGSLVHATLPAPQSGSTYNADNELASFGGKSFSYDADGNLVSDGTRTYTWNPRGQLTTVTRPSGTGTLGYDPLGRLISTSAGGVTTTSAYAGTSLIAQVGTNGTNASYLPGPFGTLSRTDNSPAGGGAVQSYLPDALDSTLALANSTGQVQTAYSYDLFGNSTSSTSADSNPLRYTGLISGPTMPAGLQDNNARDYSPTTGRFISADPAGGAGSGTNLYQYAGGDPVDYSDPSGLFIPQMAAGCLIGGLTKDLVGALAGRKHSLGDFASGFLSGCAEGALFALGGELAGAALGAFFGAGGLLGGLADVIGGASEAEAGLEGGLSSTGGAGIDGAEATTGLGDSLGDDISCAGNSFAGNTRVKLPDGTTEQISKLKPGDKVVATDPDTGATSAQPVLAVIRGHKTEYLTRVTVVVGEGRDRRTGVITATAGHPFYDLTRHGWVPAGNLHPGDRLDTLSHTNAAVVAVGRHDQRATVWNLTVGTDHTYYVVTARASVLVHNCSAAEAAQQYASQLLETVTGRPPTAAAAAVDRTTGEVFFGYSGELSQAPSELADLLPNPSMEPWSAWNCAEVAACSKAIANGSQLENLDVATVRTATGEDFPPCDNCRSWLP